jgi:hypothetical protein
MPQSPKEMTTAILAGALLPPSMFEQLDCNAILDARDADAAYERDWLLAHDEQKARWMATGANLTETADVDALRRGAFLAVYAVTKHPELAGEISDDFELIAWAALLRAENPFVECLWGSYSVGAVPIPNPRSH